MTRTPILARLSERSIASNPTNAKDLAASVSMDTSQILDFVGPLIDNHAAAMEHTIEVHLGGDVALPHIQK